MSSRRQKRSSPSEETPEAPARALAPAEVDAALAALEALAADPVQLARLAPETLKRLRKAAGLVALPDRLARRKNARLRRRADRVAKRENDATALAATSNRALKRALRFPVPPPDVDLDDETRRLLEQQAPDAGPRPADEPVELSDARNCYVCKEDYAEVHHHYDSMCPTCATLNWRKRHQTADLSGRVAVITGSRVKIGYEATLMLLRAGARVIATTRFPCDSARRFAAEPDFEAWRERLEIHGLDLRHTPSIETFAAHLEASVTRLDFLIHNACQTVLRPPDYYRHLLDQEREDELAKDERALLGEWSAAFRPAALKARAESGAVQRADVAERHGLGLARSAELSGLDLLGEGDLAHLFPAGIQDGEGQQLDLRHGNSWRMNLAEVPTVEMIEVQLVNQIAPFVLTARLKPLMLRAPERDKHVVNVSAMEGQFYRSCKTTRHPHTNMAKAALNMMTRTSAAEFAADGIHMNSVDTGWVTDEDPFEKTVAKEAEHDFVPPLDSIDGAARVLDPIFTGFLTGTHCWGQFLKDYRPTSW